MLHRLTTRQLRSGAAPQTARPTRPLGAHARKLGKLPVTVRTPRPRDPHPSKKQNWPATAGMTFLHADQQEAAAAARSQCAFQVPTHGHSKHRRPTRVTNDPLLSPLEPIAVTNHVQVATTTASRTALLPSPSDHRCPGQDRKYGSSRGASKPRDPTGGAPARGRPSNRFWHNEGTRLR